jgi:hypothetical protein
MTTQTNSTTSAHASDSVNHASSATSRSGCCTGPAATTVVPAEPVTSTCCGTVAEAHQSGACCGTVAKVDAVNAGAGCCG